MTRTIYALIALCLTVNLYAQETSPITKIPFELDGNHTFIKLRINDSDTLDFVFDTGAGGTVINSETATRLKFDNSKEAITTGASGQVSVSIIENKVVHLNSLEIHKVDLQSSPLIHLEKSIGRDIDGIIGYHILQHFVVKINYDSSEIEIYKSKGFKYKGDGEVVKIDLGRIPTSKFKISLNGQDYIDEWFILDSGASFAMGFTTPFSEKHTMKDVLGKTYQIKSKGLSSAISAVDVARLNTLKIADKDYLNFPVSLYDTKVGVLATEQVAGIVGNEILKRFNITFDYRRKRSYWEANEAFKNDPITVSYTSLRLSLDDAKSKVVVDNILSQTTAAKTELEVGDEIIEIDGTKASDVSLNELRKLLDQNGKKVKIIYKRNDQVKETSIELKPLI